MAFIDELEGKIRDTYFAVLNKKHQTGIKGKTLNCDSFRKIAEEVKNVIISGQNGAEVFEIANNIILKILKTNFFVYENHQMAALIGYIYLKRQQATVNNYSLNGINNNSTLDEIRILTASWQKR